MKQDDPILLTADEMLIEIAQAQAEAARIQANYDRAVNNVKAYFAGKINPVKDKLAARAKDLEKHAKRHKGVLFAETDRVNLPHGDLTYSKSQAVVKAKGVTVEVLERLGYLDGVKIEKSVDWDVVGTWSDVKLTAIGTHKKNKVSFGYELKEQKHDTG